MSALAPGPYVSRRDSAPPASAPTDSSVSFITGYTETGPITPQLILSLDDLVAAYGDRVAYGLVYDWAETFFREGGSKLYVARVTGPSPVHSSGKIYDQSGSTNSDVALNVTARDYGAAGDTLTVDVIAGSSGGLFKIQTSQAGTILEVSPDLADVTSAVAWSPSSQYLRLTAGLSNEDPRVQTAALSGGTDDHGNATDTQWLAAVSSFTRDLGPGQVAMPGRTTDQAHLNLLAHAAANNRHALCDPADTPTVATLTAAAAAARTDGDFGALWAPWATIPGVTADTTRTVPWSAVQAGIIARNDSLGVSPDIESAGINGVARYAIGLSQPAWNDADRKTLNNAGVNIARTLYGGPPRAYGDRTLADPALDPVYGQIGNARLVMEISAQADVIAERFVFAQLDGRGFTLGEFASELAGMLTGWFNAGSLYGQTVDEAFTVDVGAQINTPTSIAAGELNAQITLRISPAAEIVQIFITKRAITQEVS